MKLNRTNKKITSLLFSILMITSVFAGFVTPVVTTEPIVNVTLVPPPPSSYIAGWVNDTDRVAVADAEMVAWNEMTEIHGWAMNDVRIINTTKSYSDQIIVLNRSLIIQDGGNLTFRNVTLKMNSAFDGQYHIEVQSNGSFNIYDNNTAPSVITNGPANRTARFSFVVRPGATFKMENSRLHNATGVTIMADGAVLKNNLLSNNIRGIILMNSSRATIVNNNVSNNMGIGIFFSNSSHNRVVNNTVNNNWGHGIGLISSNNNNLTNNIANSNHGNGIRLDGSSNNNLTNNIANSNIGWSGIRLEGSNNNLTNNIANSNGVNGIILWVSDNNTLTNNNASFNSDTGIFLHGSNNNTLTNNIANSNHDWWRGIGNGISLSWAANNTLINNTANSNGRGGILMEMSNNNTLTNNIANSNGGGGIHLGGSNNNNLTNNTANSNNWYGIDLFWSLNNNLTNNTMTLNTRGLVVWGGQCKL